MKITNKSEVFKAAWKFFRANKITFSYALKMAWNVYRTNKRNEEAKANKPAQTEEEKMVQKAYTWAFLNVSKTHAGMNHLEWTKYYNDHKDEGTVWQLAARYARMSDSTIYSLS